MKQLDKYKEDFYYEIKREIIRDFSLEIKVEKESDSPSSISFNTLRCSMLKALLKSIDKKFFLAPIAPGAGKTSNTAKWLCEWLADGTAQKGGVILFLSTLAEVEDYASRLSDYPKSFACVTSDENKINKLGLGRSKANEAPILITTQQRFWDNISIGGYEAIEDFHYKGKPRALRIWDEGMLPAQPILFDSDDLSTLSRPLRVTHKPLLRHVKDLWATADTLTHGKTLEVPTDIATLAKAVAENPWRLNDSQKKLIDQLKCLTSPMMEVAEYLGGNTLTGCSARVPADTAPIFILDGSGDVRTLYDCWESHHPDFERLPAVSINYNALTIRLAKVGSGKIALSNPHKRIQIVNAAADTINAKPDEEWLVLYSKAGSSSAKSWFDGKLHRPVNVQFLNWGRHFGTNEFRHIKNMIILGTNAYTPPTYTAIYLAASGATPGFTDSADIASIKKGEICHHIRQAVCRTNVRNPTGSICGDATVYLMAGTADMNGILEITFPGCTIEDWNPLHRKLPRWKVIFEELRLHFATRTNVEISKKDLALKSGITAKQLNRALEKNKDFDSAIGKLGIASIRGGFLRMPASA